MSSTGTRSWCPPTGTLGAKSGLSVKDSIWTAYRLLGPLKSKMLQSLSSRRRMLPSRTKMLMTALAPCWCLSRPFKTPNAIQVLPIQLLPMETKSKSRLQTCRPSSPNKSSSWSNCGPRTTRNAPASLPLSWKCLLWRMRAESTSTSARCSSTWVAFKLMRMTC